MGNRGNEKIFGIGAHKTGTTSLSEALNMLGIRCSHWDQHLDIRQDLHIGNYKLRILENYDAVTDLPIPAIYHELDREFPNSKFILTIRNPEDWANSVERHLLKTSDVLNRQNNSLIFEEYLFYGVLYYDRKLALERFEEHCGEVVSYFSGRPDDLLIMDITQGDGWAKLCGFLELPEPSWPFPHLRL